MPDNIESLDLLGIADGYTPAENYDPSDEEQKIVQEVQQRWEEGVEVRRPYENMWELYLLFLKGEQLLFRDRDSGDLVRVVDYDSKRLYSVNNQLRPTARSLVGKLTALMPTYHITPATGEQEEIHGAQAGSIFFKYFRRRLNFEECYINMTRDLTWAGVGCCELGWDPQGGAKVAVCPECEFLDPDHTTEGSECPVCAADALEAQTNMAQALMQEERLGIPSPPPEPPVEIPRLEPAFEGELFLRKIDPRDIVVEPGVEDPKKLRWAIIREAVPVTEARRRFPRISEFIRSEGGIYADRVARMTYSTVHGTWGTTRLDDHVYIYTMYEAPSAIYESGRVTWIVGDMVGDQVEGLYEDFERLPLFWQFWERNPGEFYPESFCQQAWHRQKELNEVETQTREACELLARTKIILPRQAQVSADEITATTGQIITYNDAVSHPPQYLMPPPIPIALVNRRGMLIDDIRVQGAITEQDQGATPTDPNGRAMAIITAETNRQLGPILKLNWREMGELHRCALVLARKMYSLDKQMLVVGEYGHEVISMQEIDLANGWDVEVELDDGLSENQAIRLQQVFEMVQLGMMNDPMTKAPDMTKAAQIARLKIPGMGPDISSSEYAAAQNLIRAIEHRDFQAALICIGPEDDPNVFSTALINWLRKRGRREPFRDDAEMKRFVRELYMYYTEYAMTGIMGMPPMLPEQQRMADQQQMQQQQAPARREPPGSNIEAEAGTRVGQADQGAEKQARMATPHES